MEKFPFIKNVLTAGIGAALLSGSEQKISHGSDHLSDREKQIMQDERSGAYTPAISEAAFETITPFGYDSGLDVPERLREENATDRYDAWRLYLGLEQEHRTFGVSKYRPENGTAAVYYTIPAREEYFLRYGLAALADGREEATLFDGDDKNSTMDNLIKADYGRASNDREYRDSISKVYEQFSKNEGEAYTAVSEIVSLQPEHTQGVMGRFTVRKGVDENGPYISYYDTWDLHPGGIFEEKEASDVLHTGKPFEIYGRIHYDPQTGESIEESLK